MIIDLRKDQAELILEALDYLLHGVYDSKYTLMLKEIRKMLQRVIKENEEKGYRVS